MKIDTSIETSVLNIIKSISKIEGLLEITGLLNRIGFHLKLKGKNLVHYLSALRRLQFALLAKKGYLLEKILILAGMESTIAKAYMKHYTQKNEEMLKNPDEYLFNFTRMDIKPKVITPTKNIKKDINQKGA